MEDKFTAVYLMVRADELQPEDQGNYDRPLAEQKERCWQFLQERDGDTKSPQVEFYTRRSQLLMDVERHRVARVVVYSLDRLGSNQEEIEGILFEFRAEGIQVLSVTD